MTETNPVAHPRQARSGNRRLTWTAGMASYLDSGALVASGLSIGGFYVTPLGLSPFQVGFLLGLQTLAFALGALIGGRLGDRIGRRTVLLASLTGYAAGVALLAIAQAPPALAVGVTLSGLAIGADLPSSLALVAESTHTRKAAHIVATQLLWVTGLGVTGMLGLLLAPLGELAGRLLFIHLLVVSIVVVLLRVNLRESPEWAAARGAERAYQASVVRARPAHRQQPGIEPNPPQGRVSAAVAAITLYYLLWNLGANTLGQFRPYLWTQLMGGNERGAAALILLSLPIALGGGLLFANKADGATRDRWVWWGSVLTALGWLTAAVSPTPAAFVVLVVCFAAGASVSGETIYKIWVQEAVPTLQRATVQGATIAAARVLAGAFALITPTVALAAPHALFIGLCVCQLAATWTAMRFMSHARR